MNCEERLLWFRVKRSLDIVFSLSALMFLSLPLLVVAILVRLIMGSPFLFRQARPGWHRQSFEMLKFRTMTDGRDEKGELLPDGKD